MLLTDDHAVIVLGHHDLGVGLGLKLTHQAGSSVLHVGALAGDQNGQRLVLRLAELDLGA